MAVISELSKQEIYELVKLYQDSWSVEGDARDQKIKECLTRLRIFPDDVKLGEKQFKGRTTHNKVKVRKALEIKLSGQVIRWAVKNRLIKTNQTIVHNDVNHVIKGIGEQVLTLTGPYGKKAYIPIWDPFWLKLLSPQS